MLLYGWFFLALMASLWREVWHMRSTLASVSALLAGIVLLYLGNGALGTLLGLRLAIDGFPTWIIGAVMSGYFVGIVAGGFHGHRLITGVGHIRAFSVLATVMSAATLAHPLLNDPIAWGLLRFVQGYCMAGLAMCTESWLNQRSTNDTRGRILSLYQIAVYVSQGVGQLLLNLGELSGFTLFVMASILLSLSLVPVAASKVQAPELPEPRRFGIRQLYAVSPLGMFGCFSSGLILGAFYSLAPLFAQKTGLSIADTTLFMGVVIIGGLVLQWPIGGLSDRLDRRTVLIGVSLSTVAVCVGLIMTTGGTLPLLLVLGAVFGGVSFTLYPLSISHANDHIDPADLVPASGGLIIAYGVGATIGPLGASVFIEAQGAPGLFTFIAAMSLGTALFAVWRMTRREAVPIDDQTPFQPVPRTSVVATEMDPRGELEEEVVPVERRQKSDDRRTWSG